MFSRKINLIIFSDHNLFHEGLFKILSEDATIQHILKATDKREAIKLIGTYDIDIMIINSRESTNTKIELVEAIKTKFPRIKILALETNLQTVLSKNMFIRHIDGCLNKEASIRELFEAIDSLTDGSRYFKVKDNSSYASVSESHDTISKREKDILRLIVEEYTASEISEKLFISKNTVQTHWKNLLAKSRSKNVVGLVKFAIRNSSV